MSKTLRDKLNKRMFDANNTGDNFILPEHFEAENHFKGKKYTSGIIEAFANFGVGGDDKIIQYPPYSKEMLSPSQLAQKTMEYRKFVDLYIMQNCETKEELIAFCEKIDRISNSERQEIYRKTIHRVGTPEQRALLRRVERKDERWYAFGRFLLKALLWLFIAGVILIPIYFIGLVIYAIFYDPVGWAYVLDLILILFLGGE
jgi:hypothetical protein